MADKRLMIDSTILIDYFRKTNKANSKLVAHFKEYDQLYISSITEFEVYNGATEVHKKFLNNMLERIVVLDFDSRAAREAPEIVTKLKIKRKTIDKPDLFIAATSVVNGLTLDTLNIKHFNQIDNLKITCGKKRYLTLISK